MKRLEKMQTDLDQANAEISLVRKQGKSLEEFLKFTQAEQDEVKDRVNTCEEDQMRNEDELIRQNIHSRRWNLIIYGIEESETENCSAKVKDVMLSSLKINEEIVNLTKLCGVHRLGKSKQTSGTVTNDQFEILREQMEFYKAFTLRLLTLKAQMTQFPLSLKTLPILRIRTGKCVKEKSPQKNV